MNQPTVGILYPGDMGSSLGRVLLEGGLRVVSTVAGRSSRTRQLCKQAELEVVPSITDVVRLADVFISAVPPSAALAIAKQYAEMATVAPTGKLYVDVNAVSSATAVEIGNVVKAAGADYIDAAINGLATVLRTDAIVYLSGIRASEFAQLLGPLHVQVVGDCPGKASALKGALAGLSKGLTAVFVEIAMMAHEEGFSEFFLARCRSYYPGIMDVVERMLPTYPRHARRRAEEMKELQDAMEVLGLRPNMVSAAMEVTLAVSKAELDPDSQPKWTARGVLEALHARRALAD